MVTFNGFSSLVSFLLVSLQFAMYEASKQFFCDMRGLKAKDIASGLLISQGSQHL